MSCLHFSLYFQAGFQVSGPSTKHDQTSSLPLYHIPLVIVSNLLVVLHYCRLRLITLLRFFYIIIPMVLTRKSVENHGHPTVAVNQFRKFRIWSSQWCQTTEMGSTSKHFVMVRSQFGNLRILSPMVDSSVVV